jgi:alkylhydroperoxidase family enzyme
VELRALRSGELQTFDARERAALAYASVLTMSNTVDDAVFEPVRAHFSEAEIIELTAVITFEICAAKFNRALEIEWSLCAR